MVLSNRQLHFGIDIRNVESPDGQLPHRPANVERILFALIEQSPEHRFVVCGTALPWTSDVAREIGVHHNAVYRNAFPSLSRDLDAILIIDPPIKNSAELTSATDFLGVPAVCLITGPSQPRGVFTTGENAESATRPRAASTAVRIISAAPESQLGVHESDIAARLKEALEEAGGSRKRIKAPVRRMRVVLQNRPNAFTARGGDTVLMEQMYSQLLRHDVDVRVAAGRANLERADLVHFINLTLADFAREAATDALKQQVPYAITPLFEDWPRYIIPATHTVTLFTRYLDSKCRQAVFDAELRHLRELRPGPQVGGEEVVSQALAIFATGESEARRLETAYPGALDRTFVVKLGFDEKWSRRTDNQSELVQQLRPKQYVLCCGRLETRKNQLMLMKALEGTGISLVFASGGFSYQAPYVELIKRYARYVPVTVLNRLPESELIQVMANAAVHALPSWYELPGLVTLEAAALGTPVVASNWGTIGDYLGADEIELCEPDNPSSIHAAIQRALTQPSPPSATPKARTFTWDAFGDGLYAVYEQLLSKRTTRTDRNYSISLSPTSQPSVEESVSTGDRSAHRYDVTVIIPVFNRAELTQECIEALAACPEQSHHELIIVDNHSTDRTPQLLTALEGDVKSIREAENVGFAAACNHAARLAEGEFLLFLNNDTRPLPGWLDALVKCAREHTKVGAVGAKLIYPEGDVQHAGVAFNDRHIPYHICQHFPADAPVVNEQRDMQAVTGACMLVPAQQFKELGGFDEAYRNGFEDVDYCLRAGQAGYRVIYCPSSVVVHREEASAGRKDFDRENLEQFVHRWSDIARTDENEILARHGWRISWGEHGGQYEAIRENKEMNVSNESRSDADPACNLAKARELYEAARFEDAAGMLQKLVESRITLAGEQAFETWQTLGNCLTKLNRVEEAEQAYLEAIRQDGSSERPYLGLGSLALVQQNWQAAMYGFMTALAKNPTAVKGELGIGVSMAARNMHRAAIDHFRRVIELDGDNVEALFYLYRSAMNADEPAAAVPAVERYLRRHPNDVDFLFNLCGAYWKMGDVPKAVQLCRRVLELDPRHPAAADVLKHLDAALLTYA